MNPFHLAIPVTSLELSRQFYGDIIGCQHGRSSAQWIDWNFFGHQLVTHLVAEMPSAPQHNAVDNHAVPVPHFGIVLDKPSWQQLADTLIAAKIEFVIEPHVRFAGQVGEQATMFLLDPCGNALEFKAFKDMDQLFAS